MQYYNEFQQLRTESKASMDEYDAGEKFLEGLDPNMLGDHWLIRLRDEHSYKTATPLQIRDTCQRMIVNRISIGGLTTEFKAGPRLKPSKYHSDVKPTQEWRTSAKGIHAKFAAREFHKKGVPVFKKHMQFQNNNNNVGRQPSHTCFIHPYGHHTNANRKRQRNDRTFSGNQGASYSGNNTFGNGNKFNKWPKRKYNSNPEASVAEQSNKRQDTKTNESFHLQIDNNNSLEQKNKDKQVEKTVSFVRNKQL